jgi:hypothetical protein
MLDAIVNIKYHKESMLNRTAQSAFSGKTVSVWQEAGVSISEHQAILPLPLQLIGSEKIGLEKGHKSLQHAMVGSFSSGLPIIGGSMSRTSLEVTEKTAQLVADSLFPRKLLADIDSDKKLLLLRSDEPLNQEEQRLLGLAEEIYRCDDYTLHSISVDEIKLMYSQLSFVPDSIALAKVDFIEPSKAEQLEETLWNEPTYSVEPSSKLLDSTFHTAEQLNISYWVKIDPDEELIPGRVYSINREWKSKGQIGANPNLLDGWLFISEDLETEAGKQHVYSIQQRDGIISRIMLRKQNERLVHAEESGRKFINNVPIQ